MNKVIEHVLDRYGTLVKITDKGNTISEKVFIQPLHYKDKSYFSINSLQTGRLDNSRYLLIGSPKLKLNRCGGTIVECNCDRYITKSTGIYMSAGEKMYVWAVLTACTVTSEDDYD